MALTHAACGGAAQPATPGGGDSGPGTDASASCAPDSVAGIGVASLGGGYDPLGYPPYSLDGCTLAYVARTAPGESWGELRLRHLATGDEIPLAPASDQPRRPSIVGDLIAWEAVVAGKSVVRLWRAGQTTTIAGPFDHAGEPRVTVDAVVLTAWLSTDDLGDTDVYLYLPASQQLVAIATGPGQQRFADVSPNLVAVSDFSEDPAGAFDPTPGILRVADIVVFDRRTLAKTVRHLVGKQAFPMLGLGAHLAYLDWGLMIPPEPKLSAYTVRVGEVASDPATDGNVKGSGQVRVYTPYVRPSVHADWIEWVDESTGGGLLRRPLDLSQAFVSTLEGRQLLGPVAGHPLTVVATPGPGELQLNGVAR
jgi:hypothetical protein